LRLQVGQRRSSRKLLLLWQRGIVNNPYHSHWMSHYRESGII
jgi:hypothetical protein